MYKLKSSKPTIQVDTQWIEKGKKCWIFNPLDDTVIFLKAKVVQFKPATYTPSASTVICELQDATKFQIPVVDIYQRNEFISILSNLTDLQVINNPQILFQLNQRFKDRKIFTFIGSNLLIINPYELIQETFDEKMIDKYYNAIFVKKVAYKDEEPHIYGMTSEVLKNIALQNEDQVIIISGESGSGKTETNKYCLKYLTNVCHKFTSNNQQVSDIQKKILNCNPLLEAFGNAKTVKNDNSSRFGKLTALKIHAKYFYIKEAFIKSFFLEKSRVTLRNKNQLNFHIFYYLVDGIPPNERENYYILNSDGSVKTIEDFYYLKTAQRLDQYKNIKQFNDVQSSMKILGIGEWSQQIWKIIMGILHLGNVTFDESTYSEQKGGSPCSISDQKGIKNTSDLFGVSHFDLQKAITLYKRKTATQEFNSPQNKRKCEQTRDSISKLIYESLFLWLISKLNTTLSSKKSHPQPNYYYLKLLDIYGFQVFDQNGYEQLAVNYTNEKLHQIYIKQVFKQQKQAFREQDIEAALINLKFADNTGVIQLIDTSTTSIYNLVDQSCTVETKDDALLSNIKKIHLEKSHQYFPESNKNLTRKAFIINHTPGPIQYSIAGFREKNKDFVRQDIIEMFSYSTNSVLNQMFKQQQKSLLQNKTKRFLSQKLRQQINNLMNQLQTGTHIHFVRCIKPNDDKLPFTFVPKMALNQIKYLGLLDTILLRRATYHIKLPYEVFYKFYSGIDFTMSNLSIKEKTQQLFKRQFMGRGVDYIFGKTKIFLKEDSKPIIDKLYQQKLRRIHSYSHLIQSYLYVPKKISEYEVKKERYYCLEALERYITNFYYGMKRMNAAQKLQRWWSKCKNLHLNRKKRKGCIVIQKYFRRLVYSVHFNAIQQKVLVIQRYFHSHACAAIHESVTKFKSEVMDEIMDAIWNRGIEMKLDTISRYLNSMSQRIREKNTIQLINKKYKDRMSKRVCKTLSQYLYSFLPSTKVQQYIKAVKYIQKSYRFLRVRKLFLNIKKSVLVIQKAWRRHRQAKQQNIKLYEKIFQKQNKKKQESMKIASEVLFKSKRLRANTIQSFLSQVDSTKSNKIFLFYYLLDYQLLVDTSLIYPQNNWINNYYTLFKQSFQKGNHLQAVTLGEAHTLLATTSRIFSWGWNDYNQLGISDRSINSILINTINLPSTAKPKSIYAFQSYSYISFIDPPCIHYFGKIEEDKDLLNMKSLSTSLNKYNINNGKVFQVVGKMCRQINIPERITHISCGAAHVVAKSHLKRVFTWGNGEKGQLGHGDYFNKERPVLLNLDIDSKVLQVSGGHSSTLLLFSNHKLFWFGTTSTISKVNRPLEVELDKKSAFIWDQNKYTPIRISSSWSRTMSIHGITFAFHYGSLSTNISLKKKILSMLSSKWTQSQSDLQNLLPPYIPSIAKYFTEKSMRMPSYRPDIEMESRKKLKQLRQVIQKELNSFKVTDSEIDSLDQTFGDRFDEFQ